MNYYRNSKPVAQVDEHSLWTREEVEGIDSAVLVDDDQFISVPFDDELFTPIVEIV